MRPLWSRIGILHGQSSDNLYRSLCPASGDARCRFGVPEASPPGLMGVSRRPPLGRL